MSSYSYLLSPGTSLNKIGVTVNGVYGCFLSRQSWSLSLLVVRTEELTLNSVPGTTCPPIYTFLALLGVTPIFTKQKLVSLFSKLESFFMSSTSKEDKLLCLNFNSEGWFIQEHLRFFFFCRSHIFIQSDRVISHQAAHPNMRTYYFCTDTGKEMELWMKAMLDAALVQTEPVKRYRLLGK